MELLERLCKKMRLNKEVKTEERVREEGRARDGEKVKAIERDEERSPKLIN